MLKAFLKAFWPYVLIGLLALTSAAYLKGRHDGSAHEKAAEIVRLQKAQAKVVKREVVAQRITDKAHAKLDAEQTRIEVRTRTIIQRVPEYVTQAASDRCVVPVGFVSLFNAAASGSSTSLPESPGRFNDSASGVQLPEVASVTALNFGVAYGWRAEAMAWRSWYAEQKAAWETR